ncbi:MAG: glycosyltransferase family 2 protein [Acidobacteria bacterium]|nr:glycosyltransferase family 2 protein [Acidobacteriota bacterium]
MFFVKFATIENVKISAVIIAFNEEDKIASAIESVKWADEILLVDSESTDRTREIAESAGARVIVRQWPGFSKQKQFAVDAAAHDWIFSLDADEIVSPELAAEILSIKAAGAPPADGFRIPRLSFYLGRPVRHGGWYPDWQLRFFDRRRGRWKDVLIHESVEIDGRVGRLKGDILHYSVENALHHHRMIGERYALLAAEQMFARGRRATVPKIMTAGLTAFVQTYFLKLGFLDGLAGFSIARFAAHHAFLKYLMLRELQENPPAK